MQTKRLVNSYGLYDVASFSEDGKYRYVLSRDWSPSGRVLVWIMLNPSIGNEKILEPTTAGCMKRAINWDFSGMIVINLFALISVNPHELKKAKGPIGPYNNEIIENIFTKANSDALFIAAWGNHGKHLDRDKEVANAILTERDLYCLGTNKDGSPRHPLHMSHSIQPELWRNAGEFCF